MDRCPNCRASYTGGDTCRRCGMELATLLAVETAADHFARLGLAQLAAGDPGAAESLRQAGALRSDPFLDLLISFAESERAGDSADDPSADNFL